MKQPPRKQLIAIGKDAIRLTVWTDVPLERLQEINGVYDAWGGEPGPKVVMCDPRYKVVDIETAIHQLARALEESTDV